MLEYPILVYPNLFRAEIGDGPLVFIAGDEVEENLLRSGVKRELAVRGSAGLRGGEYRDQKYGAEGYEAHDREYKRMPESGVLA
jgi:hypothetical protein